MKKHSLAVLQVFDFEITENDMKKLNSFDEYFVCGWDPTRGP